MTLSRLFFASLGLASLSLQADMVDTNADLKALPTVPGGYEISLFAQEPLVQQPCSMAFDVKGRLFIGMGPQYRNPTPETPGDSVVIVTDENKDGKADKTHTFATGLNAIQSLAWRGRDLWVANSPDLTIVRDLDGDDVADEYVKVFTDLGNLEHGLHGLVWAPDGKLYMSKGNSKGLNDPKQPDRIAPKPFRELFGQSTQSETTKPQTFTPAVYKHTYHDPKDDWGVMGGVLRCDDLGVNLEIVSRGFRNPWDIAIDDTFNWLGTDNDQNEGDRVFMPFYGAHFGWNHPWSSSWTGEDHLPTVPVSHDVFHGSGTGITFGSLGDHKNVFFINDWLNKTTYIYQPKWKGALMTSEWQPFIQGGKSLFRPTDMVMGPDGALWCLSWSRGYGSEFKDGKMTNEGRIYCVTYADKHQGVALTKPAKECSTAELIALFDSNLVVHRIDAQDELVRRGAEAKPVIIQALESGKLSPAAETWAVWALGRIGPDPFFEKALEKPGNLRLQSLRILAKQTLPSKVADLTRDDDPRTRFEAVQAIWQARDVKMIPALLTVAAKEKDRLTYYSAWRALRDLASTSDLKKWLGDERGGVRRAALLALLEDSALTQNEVKPLLNDADKETKALADLWIKNTTGGSPSIALRGKGVIAANVAPITGDPPKITPPASPTTVDAALDAMKTADPARGRLLALHPGGATCTACHYIGGRGNQFGPDLTGIGLRADAKHLLQSMIEPSAVITEGFNSHVITTAQGVQSGVLLDESGLAVTLGLITGQRARIMRADITKHDTLPVSAMPPFAAVLDPQSCADIAAWLIQSSTVPEKKPNKKDDKKEDKKPSKHAKDGSDVQPVPETKPVKTYGDAAKGFNIDQHDSKLALKHDGKSIADFVLSHPQVKRPFMIHLRNREGTLLTRHFPPEKDDAQDHADMHPGLWLAFGGINGTDFWRNEGRVEVSKVTVQPDGSGFETENRWLAADGKEICRDITRITTSLKDGKIVLHWDTRISSQDNELTILGQEEGGLGVRLAKSLTVRDGSGHITNSEGMTDEKAIWGQPASWWRYGTDSAGIRITPSKEGTRTFWSHARDYGALVINPTGTPNEKKKPSSFTVPKGEPLKLIFDITLE
ncbi:PVC-type heme-binding CxxCH protein [Brevifollis gellanilyticus]|uniref:Cytochrome c domain-containing protein n=1 Tax=Brevifollis gellanilyticus TaxID=748831 RepID=A0A512M4T4_9BACT|nr:PVC-type heme-binding CxxCH protein [Brevifollis gellanilyticus]GEP41737.1 hypothetical protein BGE01nite_10280 [Brevifollis gellanilyticus]